MYCGSGLSPVEGAPEAAKDVLSPSRARELLAALSDAARAMMPPEVLSSLKAAAAEAPPPLAPPQPPPIVRSSIGFTGLGRRGTTSTTLPPVKGPTPAPSEAYHYRTTDPPSPAREEDSLEPLPSDRMSPLPLAPIEAELPEDPPTLEHMNAVGDDAILEHRRATEDDSILPISTAAIRPLDTAEMDALPLDALSSFYDLEPLGEELTPGPGPLEGPITRALRRGGGPFGPRDTPFRLILLPEEGYRTKVHWLRHRLADTTGIDLYTAAQTLSKEVPSFLFGCDQAADAYERAEHLRQGGLSVLVLDPEARAYDIEPIYVEEARGDRPDAVRFKTAAGAWIEVKRPGLAWACLGDIGPDGDRQSHVRERTFRGRSVPERPTFDGASGPYLLLDLFLTLATQPVRIRSDRFDFGCLGSNRELAAALNLRRMLTWLSPDAMRPLPLDERFKRVPRLRVSAPQPQADGVAPVPQRELEFTEYGLILNAQHRGANTA